MIKYLLETRSKLDIKADSVLCQDHCNLNFFLPKYVRFLISE